VSHICLHDKREIESFLEKDPYLHIYGLGDLDDFFWPSTTWYGIRFRGSLRGVVLLYAGPQIPTVVGLTNEQDIIEQDIMAKLLSSVRHLLPYRFQAHLSPGLEAVFRATCDVEPGGEHYKMMLVDGRKAASMDTRGVVRLETGDLPLLESLYRDSYPGNWFDPRMLETNQYFGIKEGGRVLSAGGVHVFSMRYRVAALGNIATRPGCRNRGYGTRVAAALCRSLYDVGVRIGLNVRTDNAAAISCYRKIGFEVAARYGEFMIQRDTTM
jgi:ribosomal protein S18 acetylase RimI-like enzyme